jgi:hypothetical protein
MNKSEKINFIQQGQKTTTEEALNIFDLVE